MGRKLGVCVPPFWGGRLSPDLAQCGLDRGPPPCQVPSLSIQPFDHNRHRPKIGEGLCPVAKGDLGPRLTHCGRSRGLPACQVSSSSIQPFGHNTPTSQTGQTDRQTVRSDSVGRTVLQTVAQKNFTSVVSLLLAHAAFSQSRHETSQQIVFPVHARGVKSA